MLNLKEITKRGEFPSRFGYLVEPMGDYHSDEELYAGVRANGRAVVREFKGATYELGPISSWKPEDFEATWRGD